MEQITLFLLILLPLVPFAIRYSFGFQLKALGLYLRTKSSSRRAYLLATTLTNLKEIREKTKAANSKDGDWEKIEGYASAPNGGKLPENADWPGIVGFFHPFCAAGGGGERVLWAAVLATQQKWPKATCVVYSGDHEVNRAAMIEKAKTSFGIKIHPATLHIAYLSTRHLVLANAYPYFTLLGQSLGSLVLAYDAFSLIVPDIFVDTMGYAFGLALCKYLFPTVPTAAYVHYPTISTDMLSSLEDQTGIQGLNSGAGVGVRGLVKKVYWRLFAMLYGWVGGHIDVVMCNSTWTQGHISKLWKGKFSASTSVLYPPCPVEEFETKIDVSAKSEARREHMLLYIAQFRREKNHSLILKAFAKHYHSLSKAEQRKTKLVLIGSVRLDTPDEKHIYKLRLHARELNIDTATTFVTNAKFSVVLEYLQRATIGVNGMWNEHFGIGVVEYQAAGCIPVVHDSGGPKLDIVVPYEGKLTGYHAETYDQFAEGFRRIMSMSTEDRIAMRLRGRANAKRFSEEVFATKWVAEMENLIRMHIAKADRL